MDNTAPAAWPSPATPLPVRQLWQVPAFLLGLAALAGFLVARPLWLDPLARARAQLVEARRLLDRPGAADRAAGLAQAYLEKAGDGGLAGEAHFLLGSARARSARDAGGDAPALWREALGHLERAERLGVPPGDDALLRFRLGLCGSHTGMDPRRVAELLAGSVQESDDKVEGFRLLGQAYLRLPAPDLEAALRANEELRQLPLLGEEVLGPARVEGGELLLRLRRPGEARKVLEKVAPSAPASVLARSRVLRARSHQDEGNWAEAAALWKETLADRLRPPADPGEVRYQLGLCYRRLEQLADAARAWGEGSRTGKGEPAAAAALGLAEVMLAEGNPVGAVEAFERAARDVHRPEDWKNGLVDLAQARALFERGCEQLRKNGDFEPAVALAKLYERLAPPGQAALLLGRASEAWAQALQEQAPRAGSAPAARDLVGRAASLFRQAGEAYARSAESAAGLRERAQRLWLAAGGYLRGQDAARAAPVLRRFLELRQGRELTGEAWYLLAESYRRLGSERDAEAAYRECVKYPGRFAYRARFQLSQAELKRGQIDQAVEILEQNIQQLRLDDDAEAMEKSVFALGGLLFRVRRSYQAARPLLEEAVSKFPDSPAALRGRYELAECYRNLADQQQLNEAMTRSLNPEAREHYKKRHQEWLMAAAGHYAELGRALSSSGPGGPLAAQEQVEVYFNEAECRFKAGQFAEALALYEGLTERFKDRVERLRALAGLARCHAVLELMARHEQRAEQAQEQSARFRDRVAEIRVALKAVDADTRQAWERWLSSISKQP